MGKKTSLLLHGYLLYGLWNGLPQNYQACEVHVYNAWQKAITSFGKWGTAGVGPSIIEAEFVFIPVCHDNHWILFIFSTKTFEVILLHSLSNTIDYYHQEVEVLTWLLLPRLYEKLHPDHGVEWETDSIPCNMVLNRPKQTNSDDAVFM